MIFRPQRGSLAESMNEAVTINSKKTLAAYLDEPITDIQVRMYGYDERINWNTWLVTVRGDAVGFTNEEVL